MGRLTHDSTWHRYKLCSTTQPGLSVAYLMFSLHVQLLLGCRSLPFQTVRRSRENMPAGRGGEGRGEGVIHLLESRAPAPPRRKRQLQTSMERSLPTYQFWVMFSWFTIRASLLGIA